MKRVIFIPLLLCCYISIYADASYDVSTNYQYNNPQAYIGETLYLVPLTGSNMKVVDMFDPNHMQDHYHNFMDFEAFFDDDPGHATTFRQYKYDPYDKRDKTVAGTHKRHIEGHNFYVNDVVKANTEYESDDWVLYLTDLNTGEKVKYLYDGESLKPEIDFENFPFVVDKHMRYLKSLIGTKLVFATAPVKGTEFYESYIPYYTATFKKDIYTGEEITYSGSYAKWTIKDVSLDVFESAIFFIVTNGKNTTRVVYNNPYSSHHPKYNVGCRVFPEKQWNKLVDKFGEGHMSLIMQTKVSNDMTAVEKYMAGGRKLAKSSNSNNQNKSAGKSINESAKETVKDIKGFFGF